MGWLLCCMVTLLLSHILSLCNCQDKIVPGQNITGNDTLVSSLGKFSLGFFNPENSTKYFLGIRYNTFPDTALVWIANRDSPLDSPGVLMLSSDGNLVVLDQTRNLVWSTNASLSASATNHTTGLLADTGNLCLSFEEATLWQSFDHPSDTMLPGVKFSLNKKTGQQRSLTSWAALDDPQPGKFTFGIDPQVPLQGITWNGTTPYYRSAVYAGKLTRSEFQNQGGSAYFFSFNTDADEVYGVFTVSDSSVKLRFWLSPTGQLQQLLWQDSSNSWLEQGHLPGDNCDFYAHCGPNSACRSGESLSSLPCKCLTGFKAKFPNQSAVGNWSGGCIREEVLACGNGIQGNFSRLEKVKLPDHTVLLNNRSMSECESECGRNCTCTAYAYINGTAGSTGKCLAWFGELLDLVENRKNTDTIDVYIRVYGSYESGTKDLSVLKRTLVIVIVSTAVGLLTITTGYFLWKKKLGKIARTVSENISKVGAGGGKNDTELPLFSLRSILAATNNFSDANKLGEGGFGPVYKGILPEDVDVVADVGLANEEEYCFKGTGYMSPEYARYGHFSEKSDVFSFGVLLLEIVSGKKNASFYRFERSLTLSGWAWDLWKEGRGTEVIDASIRESIRIHEALRCTHVGLLCVQESAADRPAMESVIHMLQGNEATFLPPTKEPAFSTQTNISTATGSSSQTSTNYSNNALTISLPEAR